MSRFAIEPIRSQPAHVQSPLRHHSLSAWLVAFTNRALADLQKSLATTSLSTPIVAALLLSSYLAGLCQTASAALPSAPLFSRCNSDRPLRDFASGVATTSERLVQSTVSAVTGKPLRLKNPAHRPATHQPSTSRSTPPIRLVSENVHATSRQRLPIVDDELVQAILESDDLIFYSEREIPRAFPKWDGLAAGVHDAYFNISAESGEPYGNGNREFPWDEAAGVHRSPNVQTIHFLSLPRDAQGKVLPIVYSTQTAGAQGEGRVSWRFPHGTLFGECLLIRFDNDQWLPCELRIRKRVESDWEVDVFRPFPTALSLAQRIKVIRPEWESDPDLAQAIATLENPNSLRRGVLRDHHPVRTFDQVAGVDELPQLPSALVTTLLETTLFQSCSHTPWKVNDEGLECYAPTSQFTQQIVPQKFDAGFISVDAVSCLRCHQTVGENVSRFESNREWYGHIRGSDGIFSFHPFARSAISHNGHSVPVALRSDWIKAGILARFDRNVHSTEYYSVFSNR